jgi:hypothetical protein
MADLATRLRTLQLDLERRRGRREAALESISREEQNEKDQHAAAELAEHAGEVLQAAIEARRLELRDRVELLVTRGLRAVFGRADLEFFFEQSTWGKISGITPGLRSAFGEKVIEADIVDGHGGGIADVISFLLRVVVLSLARPRLAPVLILDEPFRHVSLEYLRGCSSLLRELNRSAGIQFVLVTHKPELVDAADVVYRSSIENGATKYVLEDDVKDDVFHQKAAAGAKRPETSKLDSEPTKDLIGPGRGGADGSALSDAIVTTDSKVNEEPGSARDPVARMQRQRPGLKTPQTISGSAGPKIPTRNGNVPREEKRATRRRIDRVVRRAEDGEDVSESPGDLE